MDELISRAKAVEALSTITMYKGSIPYNTAVMRIEQLPSAQPKNENLKFLEFLWNTINPNEMEQYLEMYSSKEVKSNG